jgi:hypothetical protein
MKVMPARQFSLQKHPFCNGRLRRAGSCLERGKREARDSLALRGSGVGHGSRVGEVTATELFR